MDYSLPNAFLDFARLINDFVNQNVEEKPEETDLPVSSETEEKDNIIIVGSGREEEPGTNSEAEQEEPEIRGGIVEKAILLRNLHSAILFSSEIILYIRHRTSDFSKIPLLHTSQDLI